MESTNLQLEPPARVCPTRSRVAMAVARIAAKAATCAAADSTRPRGIVASSAIVAAAPARLRAMPEHSKDPCIGRHEDRRPARERCRARGAELVERIRYRVVEPGGDEHDPQQQKEVQIAMDDQRESRALPAGAESIACSIRSSSPKYVHQREALSATDPTAREAAPARTGSGPRDRQTTRPRTTSDS